MSDQDIDVVWDRLPHNIEVRTLLHVRPFEELGRIGCTEDLESVPIGLSMDQKSDIRIIFSTNQSMLDGSRVISRNEDLRGDIQR